MLANLDQDTLLKVYAAFAVVLAAFVGGLIALSAQVVVKRLELRAQARRDLATQRLTLFLPLVRFTYELDSRIGRIFKYLDTDWLSAQHLDKIRREEGFAKDPLEKGYFIMSSIYVLACFFAWTEEIKRGIDATKWSSGRTRRQRLIARARRALTHRGLFTSGEIFSFDQDVNTVGRLFQYQELFKDYIVNRKLVAPKDAYKLHRYFQHSIGEMMLQRDDGIVRCKTFREFYDSYRTEATFRYWFVPLEELLVDLAEFPKDKDIETQAEMRNDIRPLRLLAIRYWCRILMRNMSRELGIQTPPADAVLEGLSQPLRHTITSIEIERLEPFLT